MVRLRGLIRIAKMAQRVYYNQPRIKGLISEAEVRFHLKAEKYLLYNITLGGEYPTQIDHVLFNQKGIIVIETKNYQGLIIGQEEMKTWTQVIGQNRIAFYNPILQNKTHIKKLKEVLRPANVPIYSIIAFSTKAQLRVQATTKVIHITQLLETIAQFPNANFEESDQCYFYNQLKSMNKSSS